MWISSGGEDQQYKHDHEGNKKNREPKNDSQWIVSALLILDGNGLADCSCRPVGWAGRAEVSAFRSFLRWMDGIFPFQNVIKSATRRI
jgi:hypothetical protein